MLKSTPNSHGNIRDLLRQRRNAQTSKDCKTELAEAKAEMTARSTEPTIFEYVLGFDDIDENNNTQQTEAEFKYDLDFDAMVKSVTEDQPSPKRMQQELKWWYKKHLLPSMPTSHTHTDLTRDPASKTSTF